MTWIVDESLSLMRNQSELLVGPFDFDYVWLLVNYWLLW